MFSATTKLFSGIFMATLLAGMLNGVLLFYPQRAHAEQAYCTLGETRVWRSPEIQASVGNFTTRSDSSYAIYQPDAGWTPWKVEFEKSVDRGITNASFEYLQANSSYISVTQLNQSHEQLTDFLASYKDSNGNFLDAKGYLSSKMSQYYHDSQSFATTHKTVKINIQARGHGQFSDKTSKIAGSLTIQERCVGQPVVSGHVAKMKTELLSVLYPYAVVCIKNLTRQTLQYQIKWGEDGKWMNVSSKSNYFQPFWWKYARGSQSSPTMYIRYDSSFATGFQETVHTLRKFAAPGNECARGYSYHFKIDGQKIQLYDSGN